MQRQKRLTVVCHSHPFVKALVQTDVSDKVITSTSISKQIHNSQCNKGKGVR